MNQPSFLIVTRTGHFLPCVGEVLDYYDSRIDRGILKVCPRCKHYRLYRGNVADLGDIKITLCTCGGPMQQVS